MNCVEKYRGRLIRSLNRDLRIVAAQPEEIAVHEFRVGMKRLRALYFFFECIDPDTAARRHLQPYRKIYRAAGLIRDAHIATGLLNSLDSIDAADRKRMNLALRAKIRRDHRALQQVIELKSGGRIRVSTIKSIGISARAMMDAKPVVLNQLLDQILPEHDVMTAKQWHQKRILLKSYHHIFDAFQFCPGHVQDETELKQIRMLEQLLGDWHDRVVTTELLQSLPDVGTSSEQAVKLMNKQDRLLLGAAKIYLHKYALWHGAR